MNNSSANRRERKWVLAKRCLMTVEPYELRLTELTNRQETQAQATLGNQATLIAQKNLGLLKTERIRSKIKCP